MVGGAIGEAGMEQVYDFAMVIKLTGQHSGAVGLLPTTTEELITIGESNERRLRLCVTLVG